MEGIVPEEHPEASLRGAAVIIDSTEVLAFIAGVEKIMAGEEEEEEGGATDIVYLEGGEVAYKTIGVEAVANKDEHKDPFEHIMKRT